MDKSNYYRFFDTIIMINFSKFELKKEQADVILGLCADVVKKYYDVIIFFTLKEKKTEPFIAF